MKCPSHKQVNTNKKRWKKFNHFERYIRIRKIYIIYLNLYGGLWNTHDDDALFESRLWWKISANFLEQTQHAKKRQHFSYSNRIMMMRGDEHYETENCANFSMLTDFYYDYSANVGAKIFILRISDEMIYTQTHFYCKLSYLWISLHERKSYDDDGRKIK